MGYWQGDSTATAISPISVSDLVQYDKRRDITLRVSFFKLVWHMKALVITGKMLWQCVKIVAEYLLYPKIKSSVTIHFVN